jgi:prolyl oligopeptidase
VIEGAKYASPSWTAKSDGFFYTWLPTDPAIAPPARPGHAEIRFHQLGSDPKSDPVVRGKTGDPTKFLSAELAKDGSLLVLTIWNGWSSSDVYVQDLRGGAKPGTFLPLAVGTESTFEVTPHAGKLWVRTDEGAPRWRLFEVDPRKLDRASWKEVVPEHPSATLQSFHLIGGKLALHWLDKAASRLDLRGLDGKLQQEVKLPGIATVNAVTGLPDDDEAFLAIESFTMPTEIHRLSVKTGKTEKTSGITAPIDPSKFTVDQLTYASKDGTPVTMFLVRGAEQKKTGDARVMIYGYGGFQGVESPFFAPTIYPWLERGGIYAVTNLRGGAEYGEAWHQAGMLDKKQNVFDDFIAAAEHLVKEGWTKPSRIAITGGSNGGLLVGAAMTQRPDLFGAVICSVPLLDMVRYEKFGSGTTWASEYGKAEDPKMFPALFAYSPYHRVKEGVAYPPLLLLSADSDDRVDPLHARKFAAMVQARSTGGPVLLRIERNSGHGGADMRKAEVAKNADRYAFALWHTRR